MFSLIIALTAIVLVIAVMLATGYFGGDIFSMGREQAGGAQLSNESQQLLAAEMSYHAQTGQGPASLQVLADEGYLVSIPKGWSSVNGYLVTAADSAPGDAACEAFNAKQGITGIPSCSDASFSSKAVCCSAD